MRNELEDSDNEDEALYQDLLERWSEAVTDSEYIAYRITEIEVE